MQNTQATIRTFPANKNGSGSEAGLQPASQDDVSSAFPYLEKISMTAKKNPYAMLTIIVSIASVIVIAVTTLSVSVIGSVFIMYGKMSSMETEQAVIMKKLEKNAESSELTDLKSQNVVARQNYMVGLMDKKQQAMVNAYDKANPMPKSQKKEN